MHVKWCVVVPLQELPDIVSSYSKLKAQGSDSSELTKLRMRGIGQHGVLFSRAGMFLILLFLLFLRDYLRIIVNTPAF